MDDGRDGVSGDGGYYVPPPTGSPDAAYPGGQGWQDLSAGQGAVPRPRGAMPSPPPRRKIGFSVIRVVVVVGIVFGGAIWTFFTAADRAGDGSIAKAGDLDVLALQVGDCFDSPGEVEEVSRIRAVPCDEAHDNEVFFEFDLPEGDALPPRQVIDDEIGARCIPAFDEFVGMAYEDSELDVFTFEPTAGSWREGDRTIMCAVYDLSGEQLVGSARGAAR